MDIAFSVNGVPIRLTEERWEHITASHDDLSGYREDCVQTVSEPDWVLRGNHGSLKAVKAYGQNRYLVVIYREVTRDDGFVITAYMTRNIRRRNVQWPRPPRKSR